MLVLVPFETPRAPAGARPTAPLRPRCAAASLHGLPLPIVCRSLRDSTLGATSCCSGDVSRALLRNPTLRPPHAVLADKSRIQSIESGRAFPAPYTTLRPSRPFQVILVTAKALRFVERRRGRRSATAPQPNPAPPYAVLADVRPSASALSFRRVPDAAARTDGRRCLCSWTSRRRAPPRRSPAYSPSSPAARGSVAPWPSFVASPIASRRCAWRYELLLGEVSRPPLRHLTSRPPYAVLADVRSSASTFS